MEKKLVHAASVYRVHQLRQSSLFVVSIWTLHNACEFPSPATQRYVESCIIFTFGFRRSAVSVLLKSEPRLLMKKCGCCYRSAWAWWSRPGWRSGRSPCWWCSCPGSGCFSRWRSSPSPPAPAWWQAGSGTETSPPASLPPPGIRGWDLSARYTIHNRASSGIFINFFKWIDICTCCLYCNAVLSSFTAFFVFKYLGCGFTEFILTVVTQENNNKTHCQTALTDKRNWKI